MKARNAVDRQDVGEMVFNGKKCVVLAHGESGHAHAFYEPEKVEVTLNPDVEEMKLIIKDKTQLEHEEHTKHEFEIGEGRVIIQNEYQLGEMKRVID